MRSGWNSEPKSQKTAQSSTFQPQLLNPRLVHLQEGNDLGQVEAVRVGMLRREPAVGQGENGEHAHFRLRQALECGHVPERRLRKVLAFLQRLTRLDRCFKYEDRNGAKAPDCTAGTKPSAVV